MTTHCASSGGAEAGDSAPEPVVEVHTSYTADALEARLGDSRGLQAAQARLQEAQNLTTGTTDSPDASSR